MASLAIGATRAGRRRSSDAGAGRPNRLRALLPSGAPLADDVLARRHRGLSRLLAVQVPLLVAAAVIDHRAMQGVGLLVPFVLFLTGALLVPDLAFGAARAGEEAPYLRLGAMSVSVGLAWCSYAVIALSGGNLEAHLYLLLMVSFVALYQDAVALFSFLIVTTMLFEITSALDPSVLYGTATIGRSPFVLASVDLLAVILVGAAVVVFWRATELQTRSSAAMATRLQRAELSAATTLAERRQATSSLLTHLARRNQSLLARQINQLDRLDSPDGSIEIRELHHLATRMRRNAESLLVLSGEEARGRYGRPEPMSTLLQRVAATAPDPTTVALLLRVDTIVAGRACSDLTHIVEELLDNALNASAPTGTPVTVEAGRAIDGSYLIVVIDHGIGMDQLSVTLANSALAKPVDTMVAQTVQLGFQVIGRLAARHGLSASVAPGQGGGIVAIVGVPETLLNATPAPDAAGHLHTGAVHTGAVHIGAVNVGAVNIGALHPGALPTGAR